MIVSGNGLRPFVNACIFCSIRFLADLSAQARVLCIGAGTGAEVLHLAGKNPGWHFTVVEPSLPMLEICEKKARATGINGRCVFHGGYLESLEAKELYDSATCFLVSQFILDTEARSSFIREIARRLRPGGLLVSTDLASDVGSGEYVELLGMWMQMMAGARVAEVERERIRRGYARDVAVLPPGEIATIIQKGGFRDPVQFFQAGLIHGWFSRRSDQL